MSAAFDPYHKWLGIPPAEQPPNLYRLLAVPLFETDADVIDGAADGRMTHLRTFSAGKNAPLAQKLLNEIAAARVTLLNPQSRAAYDAQLQSQLAALEAARMYAQQSYAPPPVLPPGMEQPTGGAPYGGFDQAPAGPTFDINAGPYSGRRSGGAPLLMVALIGILAAGATLGGLWYVLRDPQTDEVVVDNSQNPVPPDPNAVPPTPSNANPPPLNNGSTSNTNPNTATDTNPGSNDSANPPANNQTPANSPANSAPSTNPSPSNNQSPATPPTNPPQNGNPGQSPANTAGQSGIVELTGHTGPVLSVDFSRDGRFAVSAGEDKTVRVWDVARRQAIRLFEGMPSPVQCVRMSGDGKYIAIACPEPDRLLRVWDMNRPSEAVDMRLEEGVESCAFSADGTVLVAGGEGVVQVFNAQTGSSLGKFDFNGRSTAASSDGRLLAAAGPGNVVRLFEADSEEPRELRGAGGMITGIAMSGDDRVVVSGGTDRMLRVWDVQGNRQVLIQRTPGEVRSLSVNRDGRRCVSLGERFVSAWDLAERRQLFSRLQSGDCQPAVSSDGRLLMMGDTDGMVRLVMLPPLSNAPPPVEVIVGTNPPPRTGNLSELVNAPPREKVEPPSESEIAEATKQLQEAYPRTEAKTSEEQVQLAERLMQLATTSDQPVDQYALLEFAATLAQRGGDARLVSRAVDELGSRFKIDPLPIKLGELTLLAKAAKDEATVDSLVSVTTSVADAAMAAGQLEAVSDLLDAVATACAKPAGRRHAKVIAELRAEIVKAKKPWAAAQLAKTKLETDPENAEARTTLGTWVAFGEGDWSTGLPMLAAGSDEKLKTLAQADLAAEQGGPPEKLKAADAWYDAAQASSEVHKSAMLRRAGHWYSAVLPMVKQQIAKLKIEGRLDEINKLPSTGEATNGGSLKLGEPASVLGLTNLQRDAIGGGEWVRRKEAIGIEFPQYDSRFMLPVELEGNYEFEFDFTAPQGQVVAWLPVGERGCQLWIGEGQRTPVSGLSFINGAPADRNPTRTLMPKLDWTKRHTVLVRVEQAGELAKIEAQFDGKPLVRWGGPREQLAGDMRNAIRDPKQLALGVMNAPVVFHTAKVKLLDGSGRILKTSGY